jgi:hypothetical protein
MLIQKDKAESKNIRLVYEPVDHDDEMMIATDKMRLQ